MHREERSGLICVKEEARSPHQRHHSRCHRALTETQRSELVTYLNLLTHPNALKVVPNRLALCPVASRGRRRRWSDVHRCRSLIAGLRNSRAEDGSDRKAAKDTGSDFPILGSGWRREHCHGRSGHANCH